MIGIAVCDDDRNFSEKMKLLIEQYFTEHFIEINIEVFNSGADFLSDNTDYYDF